jgi:hypothetical protein
MSESDLHKRLVKAILGEVSLRIGPGGLLFVDGPHDDSDGCPPTLGQLRPDVFARGRINSEVIIGEAKTARDIDNDHTFAQLSVYFHYLANERRGELWLSVPYEAVGMGHRVCRQIRRTSAQHTVPFVVFGWLFGRTLFSRALRG